MLKRIRPTIRATDTPPDDFLASLSAETLDDLKRAVSKNCIITNRPSKVRNSEALILMTAENIANGLAAGYFEGSNKNANAYLLTETGRAAIKKLTVKDEKTAASSKQTGTSKQDAKKADASTSKQEPPKK